MRINDLFKVADVEQVWYNKEAGMVRYKVIPQRMHIILSRDSATLFNPVSTATGEEERIVIPYAGAEGCDAREFLDALKEGIMGYNPEHTAYEQAVKAAGACDGTYEGYLEFCKRLSLTMSETTAFKVFADHSYEKLRIAYEADAFGLSEAEWDSLETYRAKRKFREVLKVWDASAFLAATGHKASFEEEVMEIVRNPKLVMAGNKVIELSDPVWE